VSSDDLIFMLLMILALLFLNFTHVHLISPRQGRQELTTRQTFSAYEDQANPRTSFILSKKPMNQVDSSQPFPQPAFV
jgi:hypothetical protein